MRQINVCFSRTRRGFASLVVVIDRLETIRGKKMVHLVVVIDHLQWHTSIAKKGPRPGSNRGPLTIHSATLMRIPLRITLSEYVNHSTTRAINQNVYICLQTLRIWSYEGCLAGKPQWIHQREYGLQMLTSLG